VLHIFPVSVWQSNTGGLTQVPTDTNGARAPQKPPGPFNARNLEGPGSKSLLQKIRSRMSAHHASPEQSSHKEEPHPEGAHPTAASGEPAPVSGWWRPDEDPIPFQYLNKDKSRPCSAANRRCGRWSSPCRPQTAPHSTTEARNSHVIGFARETDCPQRNSPQASTALSLSPVQLNLRPFERV
jgi:hypothetical protein